MAVMSAIIAASITVNSASTENSRKMISTPKNTPVIGALNVAEMPPAGAAGDQDPQPVLRHLHPLAQAGGQRRTDLHDRALPADRAAHPDAHRRGDRLDHADLRADPAAALRDGDHHLGHPVPAGLARPVVDQRPVQQTADDRDDHEEAQAQPGQVRTAHVPLLAELAMPGRGPGEEVDQVPEHDRAQPGSGPHQQRQQEHAATARPQPPGRPPARILCIKQGLHYTTIVFYILRADRLVRGVPGGGAGQLEPAGGTTDRSAERSFFRTGRGACRRPCGCAGNRVARVRARVAAVTR